MVVWVGFTVCWLGLFVLGVISSSFCCSFLEFFGALFLDFGEDDGEEAVVVIPVEVSADGVV